ncbi:uncharacterized protein B0H18DRAFT_1125481 [Fomitopsis serialis]|uniref:uncharacterized protein n=1 Tax=Fomitopsis serialis TaxID=139415 RepID=UPI002008C294|nr:uncharacterized protein B0H18DRAFT_1125481 [Neoantrodia serialis]KAH9914553.1 hypothetical protein B0H18DRAFT_1125481 [Neoantrodia serialis]
MITPEQVRIQYLSYLDAMYLRFLSAPESRAPRAPLPGLLLDVYLVRQARRAAEMLAKVFNNRLTLLWDATTHPCAVPDDDELATVQYNDCADPLTIEDSKGWMLLWHLPGVIIEPFEGVIWDATMDLNPLLARNRPKASAGWRENIANFRQPQEGDELVPACVSFSPGWFQLGHDGADNVPSVSRLLADPNTALAGRAWLAEMIYLHIIISGMLHIMHPDLEPI